MRARPGRGIAADREDVASAAVILARRQAHRVPAHDSRQGEDQLLLANADGSGENVIFRRESGIKGFTTDPSWSASGDLIAVGAFELGKNTLASILVLTPEGKLVKSFPLPIR